MSFLEALGLKWVTLIPGFVGALISLKFIDGLNLWQRASTVLAGALAAAYCTPLIMEFMALSAKLEAPVAFFVGLFGMSIVGATITAIPGLVADARKK